MPNAAQMQTHLTDTCLAAQEQPAWKTSVRLKPVDAQLSPILADCCFQMRSRHQRWHFFALLTACPVLLVNQRHWTLLLSVQPVARLWMHLCQNKVSTVHNALTKQLCRVIDPQRTDCEQHLRPKVPTESLICYICVQNTKPKLLLLVYEA